MTAADIAILQTRPKIHSQSVEGGSDRDNNIIQRYWGGDDHTVNLLRLTKKNGQP